MLLNEFITGMFTRMTTMTNNLYDLGRNNMNSNIVSKTNPRGHLSDTHALSIFLQIIID